jgi:hypothetical protein
MWEGHVFFHIVVGGMVMLLNHTFKRMVVAFIWSLMSLIHGILGTSVSVILFAGNFLDIGPLAHLNKQRVLIFLFRGTNIPCVCTCPWMINAIPV